MTRKTRLWVRPQPTVHGDWQVAQGTLDERVQMAVLPPESDQQTLRVRSMLEDALRRRYGRVEEQLVLSGLLDSLTIIEFALECERMFGLSPEAVTADDFGTLSGLVQAVMTRAPHSKLRGDR